jgi:hypothetical protein
MYAITILLGGVMAPQQQKDLYPFILTILSLMDGNLEFKKAVYGDVQSYFVFEEGEMHYVPSVVRYMYVARQGGVSLAELVGPIMFNPAFILQIIAQTGGDPEIGHRGKGDIWQWSGVQQHADFNGQLRPAISWNK